MDKDKRVINEILVDIFNDILTIEQTAIRNERFNDISITEVHTLEAIGMYEAKSMSQIASTLKITVGTLTTAVSNLVKKEYVERKRLEEDRRVVLVQLTRKGKLVYRFHEKFHDNMVNQIITGINDNEKEVLIVALEKINKFFKQKYNLVEVDNKEKDNV
jgi:DNA-binding MarR family transcriptional regulator